MAVFQKATRKQVRLRMALDGLPGAGKTFTALRFATALTQHFGGRIAVINTESGAVEKYLGLNPDGIPFDFDILTLTDFAPTSYTSAIQAAGREGYTVCIVDSLSHAWEGEGGALDQVDRKSEKNKFTAWKDVTPQHRGMIESLLRSPCHVIVTMRTKMDYVLEEDERGKKVPRKVGLKPVQREGMEYEFDIIMDLDELHLGRVSKSRCPDVDGLRVMKPDATFLSPVIRWLNEGSEVDAGHFATKESDLKALQDRDRREAAQQPQKPVNFRDQLTGGGTSSASTQVASPPSAADSNEPLAEEGQILHIRSLFEQCEIPPEAAKGIIAKRGVTAIKDLTQAQAKELIDGLLAMHKKVVAEKRAAQDAADLAAKEAAGVPW